MKSANHPSACIIRRCFGSASCFVWPLSGFTCGPMASRGVRVLNDREQRKSQPRRSLPGLSGHHHAARPAPKDLNGGTKPGHGHRAYPLHRGFALITNHRGGVPGHCQVTSIRYCDLPIHARQYKRRRKRQMVNFAHSGSPTEFDRDAANRVGNTGREPQSGAVSKALQRAFSEKR
jgi:hypothetical protein